MRLLGIILFILGIIALLFGINGTQHLADEVVEVVTGKFTSNTMWYLLGGIGMIIGGGALTVLGRKAA